MWRGCTIHLKPPNAKEQNNYTDIKDTCLLRTWESVSLDAVTSIDQTGKGYWQRIEDKFFHLIALVSPITSIRVARSLQRRWDVIKSSCSRGSACLEQVRSAPASGCTIDDYDKIAMERYKDMAASKKKLFVLQHCWPLLEHNEKWRLRDNEDSPNWMMMRVTMREEGTRVGLMAGRRRRTWRKSKPWPQA